MSYGVSHGQTGPRERAHTAARRHGRWPLLFPRQSQQNRRTRPHWGKKNGLVRVGVDPLPYLDKAIAIRDTVARLISDVYQGKLHPRIAAGLAPLMHLQLRAVEKTGLERRLAKLERQVRVVLEGNRQHSDE